MKKDIITVKDDNSVQIIFEMEKNGLTYRDALYFSEEDYNALTKKEILTMKKERFKNWLASLRMG